MSCPKCQSTNAVPIDQSAKFMYCPSCNHSWAVGKEQESLNGESGSFEFSGIPTAKRVFDVLTGGRVDMTPEMRSALETQMVAIIFEQWFEGFKAGQLANIVYVRDYYGNGKARSESASSNGEHQTGTSSSGEQTSNGEDGSSGNQNQRTQERYQTVRERVGGVDFVYPKHIMVPENVLQHAAELSEKLSGENFMFNYDGRAIRVDIKTGK